MKIISEKGPLVAGLTATARVVETRNTYPILSHALLTAEGDHLTIVATDLDIEVTETVALRVEAPGVEAIPARALLDIVKKAPDGAEITIETTAESHVLIKYGRSRFNLSTLAPDSFPTLNSGKFSHTFEMQAADLRRLISKTAFAVSTEETRYYLNGIYLHSIDGRLRAVATDGHRMSRYDVDCPEGAEGLPGIIVPKKTVGEIAKLLDAGQSAVSIDASEDKVRLSIGTTVLLSKLISGTFPDYQRVTPQNNNHVVRIARKDLISAVDRVSTMSTDRGGKAVKMAFEGSKLTLVVTNQDHGEASEEMQTSDIGVLDIGFNARYLADNLNQIDAEEAELVIGDPSGPALFRDPSDSAALLLLMPMRV